MAETCCAEKENKTGSDVNYTQFDWKNYSSLFLVMGLYGLVWSVLVWSH